MGGEKMKKNSIAFLITLSLLACAFLMINFVKEKEKKQVAAEKITTTSNSLKKKALKNSVDSSERKYYSYLDEIDQSKVINQSGGSQRLLMYNPEIPKDIQSLSTNIVIGKVLSLDKADAPANDPSSPYNGEIYPWTFGKIQVLKNIQGELAPTIEFARPGGIMEEGRMFLNDAKENVDKLNRGRATRRMAPIQQSRQLVEILQYEGDFYLEAGETYLFYVYWDKEWNKGLIMGYQYGSLRLEDEQQPAEELTQRNRRAIGKTWNVVNESTKETTNLTTYLKDELGIELPAE